MSRSTSSDAVNLVYSLLSSSALKTAINGDIWKGKREQNSKKEDVVINALPVNNAKIQRGLVNVNIHVPNLEITQADGTIDRSLPNTARLKALTDIASGLLEDYWHSDQESHLEIDTDRIFENGSDHYSNIRVFYRKLKT